MSFRIPLALVPITFIAGCVYGPAPAPGAPGAPGPVAFDYYDGFYDGYYGPFTDGYWGDDGGFYYVGRDHHWARDGGGHFRRDSAQGFAHVHGSGAHREH